MWKSNQVGIATWQSEGSPWNFDARGGESGIGLVVNNEDGPQSSQLNRIVSLNPVDQDTLPTAAEQYVRGNRWSVNYPQQESSFALRLAFEPIESQDDLLVLEVTMSIQTDLLDTHPKIDLDALCHDIDSFVPDDPTGDDDVDRSGSAPISVARNPGHYAAILLGNHDSPFTTNHSTDSLLRLRLFGDFLEKGVIRKARPWIVIDRSGRPADEVRMEAWWRRLCESPLPLAP